MLGIYELDNKNQLVHKGNYKLTASNILAFHSIEVSPDDSGAIISVIKCTKYTNVS